MTNISRLSSPFLLPEQDFVIKANELKIEAWSAHFTRQVCHAHRSLIRQHVGFHGKVMLREQKRKIGNMEMKHEIRDFDPAEFLENEEMIVGYLSDALETKDVAFIADAIGVVARAKGMKRVAEDAGVSRESLYRALSASGNPEFDTVLKVLASLNIKLIAQFEPDRPSRSVA